VGVSVRFGVRYDTEFSPVWNTLQRRFTYGNFDFDKGRLIENRTHPPAPFKEQISAVFYFLFFRDCVLSSQDLRKQAYLGPLDTASIAGKNIKMDH
jgi:hypothetical protein